MAIRPVHIWGMCVHSGMVSCGIGVSHRGGWGGESQEWWTEQKFLHACGHISEAEGEPCHWQWPHVLQHSGPWFVHLVEHLSWS